MVLESPTKNLEALKQSLISLITENKLTSLQMISNMLDADSELVVGLVKSLVSDGTLSGTFSEDETRFYTSYVSSYKSILFISIIHFHTPFNLDFKP